ncbi:coiled-coil protein [Legionella quinlivanii]|uniref:Coiled-coil protein n=1 Tax=Legionella quinlivanii TaxID=45073 RepID=A0A0W0XNL6_9GAMM|nr:hypothetical protein [Legionella quinlivanii]KTD46084.1 coiled-coil protein [Legionella quinlivanii]SEG29011.1 hypothetical protein SAMN02746093_02438 [Legionella quinlivanii DSM 21216]STY10581.1 coiled-coil protein [Legionella quinlivanii]
MDATQKNRIMTRFLKEISINKGIAILPEQLAQYADLDAALESIEANGVGVIDYHTVENNPGEWHRLKDILMRNVKFAEGSPPRPTGYDAPGLLSRIAFWRRDDQLSTLPQNDYYNRRTVTSPDSVELTQLKAAARAKMEPIIKQFLHRDYPFSAANDANVKSVIGLLEKHLKTLTKGTEEYDKYKQRLDMMNDLDKINNLKLITVPDEMGGSTAYCELAESAGGVTEKASLVSLATVRQQLGNLRDGNPTNRATYTAARGNFKLGTEAIIKLPKHGEIVEVQREAMALNVSRMLGLDTTRATTMTHNGQPALFVPFDNIRLMKDFARGKTFTPLTSSKTYEHYSTLNPVGAGLHSNEYIDDFGPSLGLFYLCSDTDAMGGYNQNKALRDARSLFVFDQVIMGKDKLGLDSRLSMQPIETIVKHTRHGQGRNRTLIEDSSFNAKFDSLEQLRRRGTLLAQYADRVSYQHGQREQQLNRLLQRRDLTTTQRNAAEKELKEVKTLKKDATDLRSVIIERIKKIENVFPKHKPAEINRVELRQSLVLEKLLHNPVLFTSQGRPYKHPWTHRQANPIKSVDAIDGGRVMLTFGKDVSPEMIDYLKRQGAGASLNLRGNRQLIISRADLANLNEKMLHPEAQSVYAHDRHYLDLRDLRTMSSAYEAGNKETILASVDSYHRIMASHLPAAQKIKAMQTTQKEIQDAINGTEKKGFGAHVMKKLQFDMQQKLQAMISPLEMPANLTAAFNAAVRLDRVAEFNKVVQEAISKNRVTSAAFTTYLTDCVQRAAAATNHFEAVARSQELSDQSAAVLIQLNQPAPSLVIDDVSDDEEEIEVMPVSLVEIRSGEQQVQRELLSDVRAPTTIVTPTDGTVNDKPEDPRVDVSV